MGVLCTVTGVNTAVGCKAVGCARRRAQVHGRRVHQLGVLRQRVPVPARAAQGLAERRQRDQAGRAVTGRIDAAPGRSPGPFFLGRSGHATCGGRSFSRSLLCGFAVAAPFVPTDDAQVLERLPDRSAPQYRELEAPAGGRGGRAQRCRQRRCAGQCVLPDRAQRGRSALSRLRAGGARAVVEGSAGAHRRTGLARDDSAEQSRVRSRACRSRPCHRARTAERPRVARALHGADRAGQIRRGARRLSEALWSRAGVLCLRLHGRDRQPYRQGGGCGGDARTRAGDRCRQRTARRARGASRCWAKSRSAAATRSAGAALPGGAGRRPARSLHAGRVQRLAARQRARRGGHSARRRTRRASTRCCCDWRSRKRRCSGRKPTRASLRCARASTPAGRAATSCTGARSRAFSCS